MPFFVTLLSSDQRAMQEHAANALGSLAIGLEHRKNSTKAMGAVPELVALSSSR